MDWSAARNCPLRAPLEKAFLISVPLEVKPRPCSTLVVLASCMEKPLLPTSSAVKINRLSPEETVSNWAVTPASASLILSRISNRSSLVSISTPLPLTTKSPLKLSGSDKLEKEREDSRRALANSSTSTLKLPAAASFEASTETRELASEFALTIENTSSVAKLSAAPWSETKLELIELSTPFCCSNVA